MLYHLGYVSTETAPMTAADLSELLRDARLVNDSLGITGLLLHREDSFFQVLEGDQSSVKAIFDRISLDDRHHRIEVVFEGELADREFDDWSMGFVQLDGVELERVPGFSDALVRDPTPRVLFQELSRTRRLIQLFRTMM